MPHSLSTAAAPITLRQGNRQRFVKWMKTFGVSKLARELNTQRNTVHVWISGNKGRCVAPSTGFMTRIVDLSAQHPFEYGPLTFQDLLDGTDGFRGMHGIGYRTQRQFPTEKVGA